MSRHDRLAQLFKEACELIGSERAIFLSELKQTDAQLHVELEQLLDSSDQFQDLFVNASDQSILGLIGQRLAMPDSIGPYQIIDVIGDGGMAVVYLALQSSPQRHVAIKMIKLGMDTHQVLARFELEREVLALMDHPNIAKIYDAGVSDLGKPYFVMELVNGKSITAFCNENSLTLSERIDLMIEVCDAVEHAHRKGQIHRDLKPSNILVVQSNERSVPKIIDFGVAKSINIQASDGFETKHGQIVGTPLYMSPEQSKGVYFDVDTRADVYSLGVILRELLSGDLTEDKFRSNDLTDPTERFSEVVASVEFRCKHRHDQEQFAQSCNSEPNSIVRHLQRDLDWILLKATSANRDERYASAKELGQDLKRHVKGLPVEAHPPSSIYRMSRFVKRNKLLTALTGSLVMLLITSGIALTVGLNQAREAQRLARAAQESASAQARLAQRESVRVTAVTDFLVDLFEVSNPSANNNIDVSARSLLDQGAKQLEQNLIDEPIIQAAMYESIARVYTNLGLYDSAEPLASRALELIESYRDSDPRSSAEALRTRGLVHYHKGQYPQAEAHHRQALDIAEGLSHGVDLHVAEHLHNLATAVFEQGRYDEAQTIFTKALTIREQSDSESEEKVAESLNSLASVKRRLGDIKSAQDLYEKALQIRLELGQDLHPATAITLSNLGVTSFNLREYDRSEKLLRQSLAMQLKVFNESHPQMGTVLSNLGATLVAQNKLMEARDVLQRAAVWHRNSYGDLHPNTASALINLGTLLHRLGEFTESEALFSECIEILSKQQAQPPPILGIAHANLASTLLEQDRSAKALRHAELSLNLLGQTLPPDHPWISVAQSVLGAATGAVGDRVLGRQLLERSLPVLENTFGKEGFRTMEAGRRLERLASPL